MSTLDRYLGEREEQSPIGEKEFQYEESPVLEELLDIYESWLADRYGNEAPLSYISYSAEDVHAFSLRLKEYENHNGFSTSGHFLSVLVNEGNEDEYVITTEHLDTKLNFIGRHNTKNLTVIGDVGWRAGLFMSDGMLLIKGDAANGLGYSMSGGTLTVEGNAGNWPGDCMGGGILTIEGNAGVGIGYVMTGGILEIEGKRGYISNVWKGGEIFHKGRRVRPKPVLRRLYSELFEMMGI